MASSSKQPSIATNGNGATSQKTAYLITTKAWPLWARTDFPLEQRDQWPAMINQLRPINGLEPEDTLSLPAHPCSRKPQELTELKPADNDALLIQPQAYVHLLLLIIANVKWSEKPIPSSLITENKRG